MQRCVRSGAAGRERQDWAEWSAAGPLKGAATDPSRSEHHMGKYGLHFRKLDDLELTSVATVIAMSTPKEYIAYYKRVKGLA